MDSSLRSFIETAAYLWAAVALVAYTWFVVIVNDWMEPERAPATPDTVTQQREATWDDMVDATMPDQVTTFKEPDSSDTQTECFEALTWLFQSTTSSAQSKMTTPTETAPKNSRDTAGSLRSTPKPNARTFSSVSVGPPYVIIPTTSGSPTLSVGSRQVTLSGVLPTGAGRTWTYDVPTERNRVSLRARASTLPGGAVASSGLAYRRDTGWGEVRVSGGYAVTSDGRGGVVSVSVSTGYEW